MGTVISVVSTSDNLNKSFSVIWCLAFYLGLTLFFFKAFCYSFIIVMGITEKEELAMGNLP